MQITTKIFNEAYNVIAAKDREDLDEKFKKKFHLKDYEMDIIFERFFGQPSNGYTDDDMYDVVEKLQKYGTVPKMTLYRGCTENEYKNILATGKSFFDVPLFSENKNEAKKLGPKLIEVTSKVPMFDFTSFIGDWYTSLKKDDPEEFDMEDGDYILSTLNSEKYWLCTYDYYFNRTGENTFVLDSKQVKSTFAEKEQPDPTKKQKFSITSEMKAIYPNLKKYKEIVFSGEKMSWDDAMDFAKNKRVTIPSIKEGEDIVQFIKDNSNWTWFNFWTTMEDKKDKTRAYASYPAPRTGGWHDNYPKSVDSYLVYLQ